MHIKNAIHYFSSFLSDSGATRDTGPSTHRQASLSLRTSMQPWSAYMICIISDDQDGPSRVGYSVSLCEADVRNSDETTTRACLSISEFAVKLKRAPVNRDH